MENIWKITIAFLFSASFFVGTAFATPPKNPVSLPIGTWIMNAAGEPEQLNITSVTPDGQISGTLTLFSGGSFPNWINPAYYSKIFGFWDADAWKITFLKENQIFWIDHKLEQQHLNLGCNTIDNRTEEICHGRDQIFTGYMFGGLPCQFLSTASCTSPGQSIDTKNRITMAGSLEAFGGGLGTGATADRSIFGWVAVHQGNITQMPCTCGNQSNGIAS